MANPLTRFFKKRPEALKSVPQTRVELDDSDPAIWNNPLVQQCYLQMELGRRDIEIDIADEIVARALMDRTIKQWVDLSAEPYWSNLPSPELKLASLTEKSLDNFYAYGEGYMKVIEAFESRCEITIPKGVCVELGAGVGKHTHALARRFDRVIAVDVAADLLRVSAERLKSAKITNVRTAVLRSPQDLATFGPIDFFMAQSVLQHNPPPIQKMMLDSALGMLKVGGFALFETPDWLPGYTFSSKRFVQDAADAAVDCHCFPKTDVIRLIKSHGMELLDFAPDFNTECFGCYTYFARKISN